MRNHVEVQVKSTAGYAAMAWLLLGMTLFLFGLMAPVHAQAPAKPGAPPQLFLEDTSPKALVPTVDVFVQGTSESGGLELPQRHER